MDFKDHEMRLDAPFFIEVREGRKIIEIRLNDPKRQAIEVGQRINFICRDRPNETALVEVVGKGEFNSLEELLDAYPLESFGRIWRTKQDAKSAINYYGAKEVAKYGYLAIEIRML